MPVASAARTLGRYLMRPYPSSCCHESPAGQVTTVADGDAVLINTVRSLDAFDEQTVTEAGESSRNDSTNHEPSC